MNGPGMFGGIFWIVYSLAWLARWMITTPVGWICTAVLVMMMLLAPDPGERSGYRRDPRLTNEENQIMRELDNERRIRQQEYYGLR